MQTGWPHFHARRKITPGWDVWQVLGSLEEWMQKAACSGGGALFSEGAGFFAGNIYAPDLIVDMPWIKIIIKE